MLPLIYVVVPAFNRREKTLRFLSAFKRVDYPRARIVIADDASTDGTADAIRAQFPETVVLAGTGDLWWTGGTNLAVEYALKNGADYVLTLNDDCVMQPDFLSKMVEIAQAHPRSIVGCRIMSENEPERIWSLGATVRLRTRGLYVLNHYNERWEDVRGHVPNPFPVQTMPGNGVLVPVQAFIEVGLYDSRRFPHYHADTEFVMRAAQAGYRPLISLESVLYNHIPEPEAPPASRAEARARRHDLIWHKRSTLYWKPMWALIREHAPFGTRTLLFIRQYAPFYLPEWVLRAVFKVRKALA